jgi:hypothetical protein
MIGKCIKLELIYLKEIREMSLNPTRTRIRRIGTLREQQGELIVQLERSVALEKLCPEAFKDGKCKTQIIGNINRPLEATMTVKTEVGKVFIYPITEVPTVLLKNNPLGQKVIEMRKKK